MNRAQALKVFSQYDKKGRYVYTLPDLAKLFPDDKPKTLQEGVNRLVKDGLLQRACRGVYVFAYANSDDSHTIERIAVALRRGEYNYISLESALSEYGFISQIPIDRMMIMTTGRKGTYHTEWGTLEFTHTKRSVSDIVGHIRDVQRPLRMASPQAAWRDLKRAGRNTHLVDIEALNDD